jgi:hypothetical protein
MNLTDCCRRRIAGGAYPASYRHFRASHMGHANLIYHVGCLVWQLSSNYALLNALDAAFTGRPAASAEIAYGGFQQPIAATDAAATKQPPPPLLQQQKGRFSTIRTRPMACANTVLWGIYLLSTNPTPLVVKAASAISLLGAHEYLGQIFTAQWKKIVYAQVIIEMGIYSKLFGALPFRIPGIGYVGMRKPLPLAVYFVLRTALCKFLSDRRGKLVSPKVGKWLRYASFGARASKQHVPGRVSKW